MRLLKGRASIVAAAASWGVIGLFYNRLSSIGFAAVEIVLLRVFCAALCMTALVFFKDRALLRIRLKDFWLFIGSGVISLAFFNICYFNAMEHMDLAVAATLLYTAPIFVMIMSSIFFHEAFTMRKLLALAATVVGCVLITGALSGKGISLIGFLFGIGSGVGYALYTVFGVIALKRYRTETVTLYTFWLAFLSVLPFCRLNQMVALATESPIQTVMYTLAIGIVACLLPYWLYTKGLEDTPPSEAAIMATLEPVVAAVVGWICLNDTFSWSKLGGMVLIIGSIVLINLYSKKKNTDH